MRFVFSQVLAFSNLIKAVIFLEKAVTERNAAAQINLAWLYRKGEAGLNLSDKTERDVEVERLFGLAVAAGYKSAVWNLARMYADNRPASALSSSAEGAKLFCQSC